MPNRAPLVAAVGLIATLGTPACEVLINADFDRYGKSNSTVADAASESKSDTSVPDSTDRSTAFDSRDPDASLDVASDQTSDGEETLSAEAGDVSLDGAPVAEASTDGSSDDAASDDATDVEGDGSGEVLDTSDEASDGSVADTAPPECEAGTSRCLGNRRQTCSVSSNWDPAQPCPIDRPFCWLGECSLPPSCQPSTKCGPTGRRTGCCETLAVPRGTFSRRRGAEMYPATVSEFWLDRFEVTVGRFRQFLLSYETFRPSQDQGAHPQIPNSGWQTVWNSDLAPNAFAVRSKLACSPIATWTEQPAGNEEKPIDCVTWFEAQLFCVWDGGRLPTDAEWSYAASGTDARRYPWGSTIDHSRAVYGCGTSEDDTPCYDAAYVGSVGSKSPAGDGPWGHSDLGGNMWEWELDGDQVQWGLEFPLPCVDCARLATVTRRGRGGAFYTGASWLELPSTYVSNGPNYRNDVGFRCARNP